MRRNAAALAGARTMTVPIERSDSHAGNNGRDNSNIKVARRLIGLNTAAAAVIAYSGPSFEDQRRCC
jgi:hypothetical protein